MGNDVNEGYIELSKGIEGAPRNQYETLKGIDANAIYAGRDRGFYAPNFDIDESLDDESKAREYKNAVVGMEKEKAGNEAFSISTNRLNHG